MYIVHAGVFELEGGGVRFVHDNPCIDNNIRVITYRSVGQGVVKKISLMCQKFYDTDNPRHSQIGS